MIKDFNSMTTNCQFSKEYVLKFWVGMMDGDGSIQVNHWRKQCLQFRFVIKCKFCKHNLEMFHLFKKHLGGNVRINSKQESVIWVCDRQTHINFLIYTVFQKYPPLTSRLNAQLEFLRECQKRQDVSWYLLNRDEKYVCYQTKNHLHEKPLPLYFPEWCSGFIEAEGCFSVRMTHNNHSFSIGQNKDQYLLQHIKDYFQIQSQIRNPTRDFWLVETYRRDVFVNMADHFKRYPLLGAKSQSFDKFLQALTLFKKESNQDKKLLK